MNNLNNSLNTVKDKLGAFFSPSPFQDIVDQATSEYLLTPDWEKNLRIIDLVNAKLDNAKVCVPCTIWCVTEGGGGRGGILL